MPSAIVNATLQAAILSATSNLLAQILTSYRKDEPLSINPVPVFQFVLYTLLNCPPNYLWQQYIEHKFPAYTVVDDSDQVALEGNPVSRGKKLSVLNTSKKFLLDQTIGAAINIVLYISVIGGLKGLNGNEIIEAIRRVS
ncbi:MAG: hypothetical protein M1827_001052 [Pycnora praestabilis]|nr:MAG: hypothetical protein M1827_001052 [Pycnora praestabilis]